MIQSPSFRVTLVSRYMPRCRRAGYSLMQRQLRGVLSMPLTGCLQPARGDANNQDPHLCSRGMKCKHHDFLDAMGAGKGKEQWLRAEQRYLKAVLPDVRRLRGGCGTARTGCSSASSRRTACWRTPRRARTWTSTSRAKTGAAAAPQPRAPAPPGTTPRTGAQLSARGSAGSGLQSGWLRPVIELCCVSSL